MNGGIFLIQSSGDLVEMREHDYDSEDVLQQLLARYPNLLAGDQMDDTAPRRWLMVCREMGVLMPAPVKSEMPSTKAFALTRPERP